MALSIKYLIIKSRIFGRLTFLVLLCCHVLSVCRAQTRTVGLLFNDSTLSFPGYTLFTPLKSRMTYLIDMNGMLVHSWKSSYSPGQSVKLLPDGTLLRAAMVQGNPFASQGGVGGRVEKFDWAGNLIWYFEHYSTQYCTHHDIEYMPNGNILMIAWEKKTLSEAIAAGRNTSGATYTEVWSEKVIEVQPTGSAGGTIVWEWHIWDHVIQDFDSTKTNYGVVSQHPELFDINFGDKKTDWLHINAIRYNPARDEIMLSVHSDNELLVIDHSTSTAEAAGHSGGKRGKGGDLLYRWGNPLAYKLGKASDQKLFSQHDARWIDEGLPGAGNILVFNNGTNRPGGAYSSVDQIVPPIAADDSYSRASNSAFGPTTTVWSYAAQPTSSFYSVNIGGAVRVANGNTVICEGANGKFFEVTPSGQIVWKYVNPVSGTGILTQGQTSADIPVFKIYRYAPDYTGLTGKTLVPIGPIENYATDVSTGMERPAMCTLQQNYPNPVYSVTFIPFSLSTPGRVTLKVLDALGREVVTLVDRDLQPGDYSIPFRGENSRAGVYFYAIHSCGVTAIKKMIFMK